MKKVIIVHGWGGSPYEVPLRWLKSQLEAEGYSVELPEMPNTETPVIETWVRKLAEEVASEQETVLIGHSIGCQTILRYLETTPEDTCIGGIVLLAPWMELDKTTIEEEGEEIMAIAKPWVETPIDFEKVKKHTGKIVAIFSDNDLYVSLTQVEVFKEKLDAEIIVQKGKGHFIEGDGVVELPIVLESALKILG